MSSGCLKMSRWTNQVEWDIALAWFFERVEFCEQEMLGWYILHLNLSSVEYKRWISQEGCWVMLPVGFYWYFEYGSDLEWERLR